MTRVGLGCRAGSARVTGGACAAHGAAAARPFPLPPPEPAPPAPAAAEPRAAAPGLGRGPGPGVGWRKRRAGWVQVRWRAVTAARVGSAAPGPPSSESTSWRAVGRRAGSLTSADSTSRRSDPVSPSSVGVPCRIRPACSAGASDGPAGTVDQGLRPVAAYATRLPQLNTSAAGPTDPPRNCSGAIQPGVPTSIPAWVCC